MRTLAAILLAFAAPALAAPVPKELRKDDAARLVGEWWEARNKGTVVPDAEGARRFHFRADGVCGIEERAGRKPVTYRYALDPATTPASFTWTMGFDPATYRAYYRFDGDSLHVVYVDVKNPPPKELAPGNGDEYIELRRVK